MKKDKSPYNEKGERHGHWINYHPNGKLWYKGWYLNDEEVGYWEIYYFKIPYRKYIIH